MNYWQVAAGAEQRNYSRRFLQYGFAFVGGEKQIQTMQKVRSGDVIALKEGRSKVLAAGRVVERNGKAVGVGDKEWVRDFDGWDLPAYCHVDWHVPSQPIETKQLSRGTILVLKQPKAREIADRILKKEPRHPPHPEPRSVRKIEDSELLRFVVREGMVPPERTEGLANAFTHIRSLSRYYYEGMYERQELSRRDIREHETRTFLIMPLLIAFGWQEQQIKIELGVKQGRIDIACFSEPYRRDSSKQPNNEKCILIIETKDFSSGLDKAPKQVKGYAEHFPSCKAVLVSNGYCYKAYERDPETQQFLDEPSAYFNLLRPCDGYPLDPENVKGALEVLRLMLPQSWR
jgi:Type I restriction enzyme R protein N terminus (HSDR_N)